MPYEPITNFKDSNGVDLGKKLVTKDYLLEVYGTILENSPASGLVVTPELWTWGRGGEGRIGAPILGTFVSVPITTFAGGSNWKQVSVGDEHAAAIKTDGSLWIWGSSTNGKLGTNDITPNRTIPVTTFVGGTDWKQVSCGYTYTAAIKTDGSLWIWGNGADGRLGTNNTDSRSIPVTTFVGGTNWKLVYCGQTHTAAIKTDGSLWTWGTGGFGELGNNVQANRSTPVTTFAGGNTWKSVSSGGSTTAAIKTDGSLWVWGVSLGGRLGNNNGSFSAFATPVTTFAGGNTWKQVSARSVNMAAIKTDGTLWTWGSNGDGQLGNNLSGDGAESQHRSTPVTTFAGGTNWKQVSCGSQHMTAIKTDGSLWTWGVNNNGQLGNARSGVSERRSAPVTTFAGGTNWKSVSAGKEHSAAIQTIDYI